MKRLTRRSRTLLLLCVDSGERVKQDKAADGGNSRPHSERLMCGADLRCLKFDSRRTNETNGNDSLNQIQSGMTMVSIPGVDATNEIH